MYLNDLKRLPVTASHKNIVYAHTDVYIGILCISAVQSLLLRHQKYITFQI